MDFSFEYSVLFILIGCIILFACCYAIKSLAEVDSPSNGGQRTRVQRTGGPRRSPRRTPAVRTVTRNYYYKDHFPYNDTTIINVDEGTPSYFDAVDELIRHHNTFTPNCGNCGYSVCNCGDERRDDVVACDDDRGDCGYDGGGDDGGNDGGGGYDGGGNDAGDSGGGYDAGDSGGGYDAGDSGGGYDAGDSGGGYDGGDSGGGNDGGGDSGGGDFGGDDYLE